jgi:predicted DNA-binding protein
MDGDCWIHHTSNARWLPGNASLWEKECQATMYNLYIVLKRTQIYLDERQRRKLDRVAKRTRRTVSELIREAIDARYGATPKEDFLQALNAGFFGVWKDRKDLGSTDKFVRSLRRGSRVDRLAG